MNFMERSAWQDRTVLIAYSGKTPFRFLRWLRPGFRHCLAILEEPPFWIIADGLSSRICLSLTDSEGLMKYLILLHRAGYRVQVTRAMVRPAKRMVMAPYSCVEVVKRLIGLDARFVLTPRQLFNEIKRNNLTTKNHSLL